MVRIRSVAFSKHEALTAATSTLHFKLSERESAQRLSLWLSERSDKKIFVCMWVFVCTCVSGSTKQMAADIRGRDNVLEIK